MHAFIAWFKHGLLWSCMTYVSTLHLHKACCLLVYPWGRPLQFGAVVPHRTGSPADNSCWPYRPEPRDRCLLVRMWMWTFEWTYGSKNPQTLPSARTEWAEPLHQRLPDQSALSFRNARIWKHSSPTGELADFSQVSVSLQEQRVTVQVNCVFWTL